MARRLHPCLCGYLGESRRRQEKHRTICAQWRNRPDPRGLAIWRMTHRGSRPPCPVCGRVTHEAGCPQDEPNALWLKQGLPLSLLAVFKRVLAKRYPHGVSRNGGPASGPADALLPR